MKTERQVEITVRWHGNITRVEHLDCDQNIVLNGKDPFVSIPSEHLKKDKHALITTTAGESTLHLLPSMKALLNGKEHTVPHYALKLGDELIVNIGPFEFLICCTEAPKPIMSPFGQLGWAGMA